MNLPWFQLLSISRNSSFESSTISKLLQTLTYSLRCVWTNPYCSRLWPEQLTKWVPLLYLCHGTRVDSIEGIKKKELMSIGDLHTFIFNSNSNGQQIVGVLQQNGWAFISCTSCSRKLTKSGTFFRCNRCVSSNVTGHQSSSSDPAPVMDMESGQATESASNLGDVPKIPLGVAEASLIGSAGDENTRKRFLDWLSQGHLTVNST